MRDIPPHSEELIGSPEVQLEKLFQDVEPRWKGMSQRRLWRKAGSYDPVDPAKNHRHIWTILQETQKFKVIETSFAPSGYLESLTRNYEPSPPSNKPKSIDPISTSEGPLALISDDVMDLDSDYGLMAHLILGLLIILTLSLQYIGRGQAEDENSSPRASDNALFHCYLDQCSPILFSSSNNLRHFDWGLFPWRLLLATDV
jgi:hypothetical protein